VTEEVEMDLRDQFGDGKSKFKPVAGGDATAE